MSAAVEYLNTVLFALATDDDDGGRSTDGWAHLGRLVPQIKGGDQAAFEALVVATAGSLEAYARRFSRSNDAAEDLVQDVFARLWEQRTTLVIRGNVRGYLYAAVRNRALDVRRRDAADAARLAVVGGDDVPLGMGSGSYAADVDAERREIALRVAAALDTLPARAREAALLRWVDGLSRAEVATVMGIALGTVKNHLLLAATTVRTLLADLRDAP
jgi:RNA polymerase sigma-70 factor (ECF subfamily)